MTRRLFALSVALIAVAAMPAASAQPPEFVALADVDPTILQEIRYVTPHNFVGDPINGYQQPMCNPHP